MVDFHEERIRIVIYRWLLSCCLSDNVNGKFMKSVPSQTCNTHSIC